MVVQDFRDLLLAERPFKPFRVVMSSGVSYDVTHPEAALLTRNTLYIGTDFDRDGIPAESEMCSLIHITAVEPITNGRHKRRR